MSKETTPQQKQEMLDSFLYEIQAVENKIAAELTKIVVHADGKIDLNNPNFKDLKKSFMNALSTEPEPGKPAISVMSFAEVSRSIRGKLTKTSNGFTDEERAKIESIIEAKQKMLNDHLSMKSGIQSLITQDLKTQAIAHLALKNQDGQEYKEPQERIILENSIKKAWLLNSQINTLLTKDSSEFATTTLKNILQKHTTTFGPDATHSEPRCEVDITNLNLDIQNLIAAGTSKDVARLCTNKEKQEFGCAVTKRANFALKLPEPHIATASSAISQCDIPVIFLDDKGFRRSLSGKIAEVLKQDQNKIRNLPEDINQAFNEHASEYLIEKLVANVSKEATPKQKEKQTENLAKIILKSKIPLATLADPEFQKAISDQISSDGKVDAKPLKRVLDAYATSSALVRSTSEQTLLQSTQQIEPLREKPSSAPPSVENTHTTNKSSVQNYEQFFEQNLGKNLDERDVISQHISDIVREQAPHPLRVNDEDAVSNFVSALSLSNLLSRKELSGIQKEILNTTRKKTLNVEDLEGIIDRVRVERKVPGKVGKEEVRTLKLAGFDPDIPSESTTDRHILIHAASVEKVLKTDKPLHVQTAKVTQQPLEAKPPSPNSTKVKTGGGLAKLGEMLRPNNNKIAPISDSPRTLPPAKKPPRSR